MLKNNNKLAEAYKKTGKPAKEIIPQDVKPINIRDSLPLKFPETCESDYESPLMPNTPFEEWPGDDIALSFDFGLQSESLYTDKSNHLIVFPYSLRNEIANNLLWLRSREYVKASLFKDQIRPNLDKINSLDSKEQTERIRAPMRRNTVNNLSEREGNYNLFERYFNNGELEEKLQQSIQCYIVKGKEAQRGQTAKEPLSDTKAIAPLKGQRQSIKMPLQEEKEKPAFEPDTSNISMSRYYCRYCKWLASIYQCILDRKIVDAYNEGERTIPMKIYPQQKGIPIYNPSGRYWVKLYHMGKYRKIEIDDQIPMTKDYEALLPQCSDVKELWPVLITKALMKLYSYRYSHNSYEEAEVGDCSPLYSLTGYLCTHLSGKALFDDFNHNPHGNMLSVVLKEENFHTKKMVIVAFKREESTKASPILESNKAKDNKLTFESIPINSQEQVPKFPMITRNNPPKRLSVMTKPDKSSFIPKKNKKMPNGIYYDTAYSLIEIFSSQQFNFKCLFPIDFSDLKLNVTAKYKQLSPEEKKDYIEKLKVLRKLQKIEKEKRTNEWRSPGENSFFIKIANQSIDYSSKSLSDFTSQYSNNHIETAKKCLLNHIKFPPMDYFNATFLPQLFKDEENGEINFWTRRFYSKLLLKENQLENEETTYAIPLERENGKWISYEQLTESFSHFIVLVNPSVFKHKLLIDNIWYNYDKDLFEENANTKVIRLKGKSETEEDSEHNSGLTIVFEPNGERNLKSLSGSNREPNQFDNIIYSLSIQLFLVQPNATAHQMEFIKCKQLALLNQASAIEIPDLDLRKDYFLNLKGGIIPFGYTLQLNSNHLLLAYSYNQFLCEFKGYTSKKIAITHPNLAKGKYYLLSRIKLSNKGSESISPKFYSSFNGFENKSLRECVEVFLINMITNRKKRIIPKELFSIAFLKGESYSIEISIVPPFNVQEKSFEYELVVDNKNDIVIEGLDMVHPFEIREMFLPNNKGIVFKELLFVLT